MLWLIELQLKKIQMCLSSKLKGKYFPIHVFLIGNTFQHIWAAVRKIFVFVIDVVPAMTDKN
jgi:hypothetical protein